MVNKYLLWFFLLTCSCPVNAQRSDGKLFSGEHYRDTAFIQEFHEAFPVGKESSENQVRSITIDANDNVWIATSAGVFRKTKGDKIWINPFPENEKGPAYSVRADKQNSVWIGTWNGLYQFRDQVLQKIPGAAGPVSSVCISDEGVFAIGPSGTWFWNGNSLIKKNYSIARSVRNSISDNHHGLWIATDVGLYHCTDKGTTHLYETGKLLSAYIKGVALDDKQKLWAAGLGGISVLTANAKEKFITPREGCPSIYVNSITRAPDGTMWAGTHLGIVRFQTNGMHDLLFSRRWLLNDEVNDIAFDQSGDAWIATNGGVSAVRKQTMTLSSKQNFFYDVLMKRHIRAPCIAGQCHLQIPGEVNSFTPEDDDNDGEYTGNYLAMESFRYAVTKDPDARAKAEKAFDFLKLLQGVTGSGGFFARTIVPVEWGDKVHDGNRKYSSAELAEELVKEPRFKPVETRWRKSTDGKWLWKGDASSDEMCGHMMGYFFYYQLAATETEKKKVSRHICSIVDHLIANNFNMQDVDGTHTRWSVWSPDQLNRDAEWLPDRSQNSMEMLTFLKLAWFVSGDQKYQQQYLHLIKEEHYLKNMLNLLNQNPAWFIYFDVSLQAYLFPILLKTESDPALHHLYASLLEDWMKKRTGDKNPLLDFLYSYSSDKKSGLQASVEFLRETPLDLINWPIDHTLREDVRLTRWPVLDEIQVSELPSAKIRQVVRWDKNPWSASGGSPDTEREPVFWLLPYWMGRYLGMIGE